MYRAGIAWSIYAEVYAFVKKHKRATDSSLFDFIEITYLRWLK